jgi:chaperonin GroES
LTFRRQASKIKRVIPLFDRVLVRKATSANRTVGGIVIPESAKQKYNWGTVLEIGTGRKQADGKLIPLVVKKGKPEMINEKKKINC